MINTNFKTLVRLLLPIPLRGGRLVQALASTVALPLNTLRQRAAAYFAAVETEMEYGPRVYQLKAAIAAIGNGSPSDIYINDDMSQRTPVAIRPSLQTDFPQHELIPLANFTPGTIQDHTPVLWSKALCEPNRRFIVTAPPRMAGKEQKIRRHLDLYSLPSTTYRLVFM